MDTKNGSGNAANKSHINSILAVIYLNKVTYRHNLGILCQGREDNPIHTDAFNELIENLKEKNPTWNKTTFNYERPVTRILFMEENSDGDR